MLVPVAVILMVLWMMGLAAPQTPGRALHGLVWMVLILFVVRFA